MLRRVVSRMLRGVRRMVRCMRGVLRRVRGAETTSEASPWDRPCLHRRYESSRSPNRAAPQSVYNHGTSEGVDP